MIAKSIIDSTTQTAISDGNIKKTITHSIVGGTIAELQGGDFAAGAREILSPISQDFSKEGQILSSQLTGIVVGGLVDGDEGAELGYNIATSGERFNRQLHQDEIKHIMENAKEYAQKYNISEEQAIKELFQTAKYINDKDTQSNIPILTQKEKELGMIAYNGMDETTLNRASEFLIVSSEGKTIVDKYKESMIAQAMFTSTSEQFENTNYNLGTSIGLGEQSFMFVSPVKIGQTFYNTGKEVSPFVVKKTGQVYDDVTLGLINQVNNVAPTLTNKYILDTGNSLKIITGIDVFNGAISPEPPMTVPQLIGNRIKAWGIDPIVNSLNNEEKINNE